MNIKDELTMEILKSKELLKRHKDADLIFRTLRKYVGNLKTFYVLSDIPEPGANYLVIIVNGEKIINFILNEGQIPHTINDIQVLSIDEYKKDLGKFGEINFNIALELSKKDMAES